MCPLVVLVLLKLRWDPSFTASAAPAEFQMLDSLRMSILRLSSVFVPGGAGELSRVI